MILIPNEEKYWNFIRKLRNDCEIQKGFIEQVHITKKEQREYMYIYNNHYYICIDDSEPVGYIGEIHNDIRLAVVAMKQGTGIGKFMLNEFMKLKPDSTAKVKLTNVVSKCLFESCGFSQIAKDENFYYFKR